MKIENTFKTGDEGRILFMSDLHYNHANILKMSKRPFDDVVDMNKWIEKTLWSTKKDDIIFDLGDMFWRIDTKDARSIIERTPAKIYKIIGNHDKHNILEDLGDMFEVVTDMLEIKVSYGGIETRCVLCHYPMVSWNHKTRGSLMIHGHCHGNIDSYNTESPDLRLDIGVDSDIVEKMPGDSFLVEFSDIYDYLMKKTSGNTFQNWVWNNHVNL
jgi:calcineurin-like phosphoesterase family protein